MIFPILKTIEKITVLKQRKHLVDCQEVSGKLIQHLQIHLVGLFSFDTVNLPDPQGLIAEFWNIINNPQKVSVNILSDKNVYVQEVDGDHIIVIDIPRADRAYRPVDIDGNPISGTYRRNGEGDYRCTKEEYQAMVRDAAAVTQDALVLEEMQLDVLNGESIRSYRQRMRLSRPGHVWKHWRMRIFY